MTDIKICGISTPDALRAAADGGARYVGFVFFPRSPRNVSIDLAALLARQVPTGVRACGLFVDPDDALLDDVCGAVPLDMIQLHGHEDPARVYAIRRRLGLQVIKALPVATAEDLRAVTPWHGVADMLLLDAKPPAGSDLPGGNGLAFDWTLLTGLQIAMPWMLSGGLTPETVSEAIATARPPAVDVSSGVESSRGVKDPAKIAAFCAAVKAADRAGDDADSR